MSSEVYLDMQRTFYNDPRVDVEKHIVGYPEHNFKIPYETMILYKNGDIRYPLFPYIGGDFKALDYGCGPGRMVERMSKFINRVDGVDISPRLIEIAKKETTSNSRFFVTKGDGIPLKSTFVEHYDLVFSTLCLQHIPVRSLRNKIIHSCYEVLRHGGKAVFQMLFNFKGTIPPEHRDWFAEYTDAPATNSAHDVHITKYTIQSAMSDLNEKFDKVSFWFNRDWYTDQMLLEGCSMVFLCGEKS